MTTLALGLAQHKPLTSWNPTPGDIIFYNGFVKHWVGIVSVVDAEGFVSIVRGVLPLDVLTMGPKAIEDQKVDIDLHSIKGSSGGKYAALQHNTHGQIWYIA